MWISRHWQGSEQCGYLRSFLLHESRYSMSFIAADVYSNNSCHADSVFFITEYLLPWFSLDRTGGIKQQQVYLELAEEIKLPYQLCPLNKFIAGPAVTMLPLLFENMKRQNAKRENSYRIIVAHTSPRRISLVRIGLKYTCRLRSSLLIVDRCCALRVLRLILQKAQHVFSHYLPNPLQRQAIPKCWTFSLNFGKVRPSISTGSAEANRHTYSVEAATNGSMRQYRGFTVSAGMIS